MKALTKAEMKKYAAIGRAELRRMEREKKALIKARDNLAKAEKSYSSKMKKSSDKIERVNKRMAKG